MLFLILRGENFPLETASDSATLIPMETIIPFIGSAAIYVIIAIAGLEICKKWKILDKPGPDVPARPRVPTLQGIFLIIGFFAITAIIFPTYYDMPEFQGLAVGWAFIMIFALIDTRLESRGKKWIKAKYRLVLQVLTALIALGVWWVGIQEIVISWWNILQLSSFFMIFVTVLWFLWFMNSINRFDWIYGLASWVSTIWFITIYFLLQGVVVPYYIDVISAENLSILTIATNVSFVLALWGVIYTTIEYKPVWLLRDIGILFYGYALAYLALMWWAKIGTVLVVLSLPIFDAIWVFINRIFIMKKNPMKWDFTHLHYRLMALWWSRWEVRRFVWWWSFFSMVLMMLQGTARTNKIIIFSLMAIIFFGVNIYLFWIKKLPMEYKVGKEKDSNV